MRKLPGESGNQPITEDINFRNWRTKVSVGSWDLEDCTDIVQALSKILKDPKCAPILILYIPWPRSNNLGNYTKEKHSQVYPSTLTFTLWSISSTKHIYLVLLVTLGTLKCTLFQSFLQLCEVCTVFSHIL